jgi:hypothetical protein
MKKAIFPCLRTLLVAGICGLLAAAGSPAEAQKSCVGDSDHVTVTIMVNYAMKGDEITGVNQLGVSPDPARIDLKKGPKNVCWVSDDLAVGHHIVVRRKKVGGNPKPFLGRVFQLEKAKEGVSSGVPQISFPSGVEEVRWSYDIILKRGKKNLKRMDPVIIIGGGGGNYGPGGG